MANGSQVTGFWERWPVRMCSFNLGGCIPSPKGRRNRNEMADKNEINEIADKAECSRNDLPQRRKGAEK
jgi:hypothetical protein